MRDYAEALAVGLSVGLLYGLLKFRSPAPPLIALVGLFGMLVGEQCVSLARSRLFPPAQAAPATLTGWPAAPSPDQNLHDAPRLDRPPWSSE